MPKLKERDFASQVEDLFERFGWHWVHSRPALTDKGWRTALSGRKGFPDYFAVRPPRIVISELKSETGEIAPEQQEWLDILEQCRVPMPPNTVPED